MGKGQSVARLRRVDCSGPGIRRRRRGKGFEYLDEDGRRITEPTVIERIRDKHRRQFGISDKHRELVIHGR